jgi:hypothetical protein
VLHYGTVHQQVTDDIEPCVRTTYVLTDELGAVMEWLVLKGTIWVEEAAALSTTRFKLILAYRHRVVCRSLLRWVSRRRTRHKLVNLCSGRHGRDQTVGQANDTTSCTECLRELAAAKVIGRAYQRFTLLKMMRCVIVFMRFNRMSFDEALQYARLHYFNKDKWAPQRDNIWMIITLRFHTLHTGGYYMQ